MNRIHASFFATAIVLTFVGLHTETVVSLDDLAVRVLRAPGDGLDDLAQAELRVGPGLALASCGASDVRSDCCPAGCAVKKGPHWTHADDVLRGCMRGLGCSEGQSKDASVFMTCDCR